MGTEERLGDAGYKKLEGEGMGLIKDMQKRLFKKPGIQLRNLQTFCRSEWMVRK